MKKPLIGFIGQGFIGNSYSNDFENRKFKVVRYSLEEKYKDNRDKLKDCDIVFIAVPTPSTPKGFDDSILHGVIKLVGKGKIAVVKSTITAGTTENLQKLNPNIIVLHSPEFLTEATAAHDAAHPNRNIVGYATPSKKHIEAAKKVLAILPKAPFQLVCNAKEAELIKYGGNNWFYFKLIFVNLLYDLAMANGCDYNVIREAMSADPRIGVSHLMPVHKSGTLGSDNYNLMTKKERLLMEGGRGAGGHCFIKDFAAFVDMYKKSVHDDSKGLAVLRAIEDKNIDLLVSTGKDLDLLVGVYGDKMVNKKKKINKKK